MTSPELLKRNLKILEMYDSGNHSRKDIARILNLASVWVVHHVIFNRLRYEDDVRISQLFYKEQSAKTGKNT